MKVYRYEMPDGGGPFFTLDGVQRRTGVQLPSSDYIFGCSSEEELDKYFNGVKDIPAECGVVVRDIPDEMIILVGDQIMFPKQIIRG